MSRWDWHVKNVMPLFLSTVRSPTPQLTVSLIILNVVFLSPHKHLKLLLLNAQLLLVLAQLLLLGLKCLEEFASGNLVLV
jgi:hypothetical protein